MNKKNLIKYNRVLLIIVLGIILEIIVIIFVEGNQVKKQIDEKLFLAASNLKYYIGEDFIQKNHYIYSNKELTKISVLLNEKAKLYNLSKYYIIIKKNDSLEYLIISGNKNDLHIRNLMSQPLSLKHADKKHYEKIEEAFDNKVVYSTIRDSSSQHRDVYLLETSTGGTDYVVGVSMDISNIREIITLEIIKVFIRILVLICLVFPMFYFFKKISNNYENMEAELSIANKIDKLTGAYNRKFSLDILEERIEEYHQSGTGVTIAVFDIHNINSINKELGMETGDKLFKILFNILTFIFSPTDPIGRFESNKLIVILPRFKNKRIINFRKTIENKINFFNKNNRMKYYLEVNYLFSTYKGEGMKNFLSHTLDELNKFDKNNIKDHEEFYNNVLKAIENEEFHIYLQPKILFLQEVVEFEALIRWIHPEKGIIPPIDFIPLMEKYHLIDKVTHLIFHKTLKFAKKNNKKISINLSPISFKNHEFLNQLINEAKENSATKYISLEITEDVKIDSFNEILEKINKLKKRGYNFSLDDFGSGYSSLAYLERLPIDEVKIDKELIDNIEDGLISKTIVRFVVELSKIKGFEIICEGIETEGQLKTLLSLGVYNFQGYYFGRPAPLNVIQENIDLNVYEKLIDELKIDKKCIL